MTAHHRLIRIRGRLVSVTSHSRRQYASAIQQHVAVRGGGGSSSSSTGEATANVTPLSIRQQRLEGNKKTYRSQMSKLRMVSSLPSMAKHQKYGHLLNWLLAHGTRQSLVRHVLPIHITMSAFMTHLRKKAKAQPPHTAVAKHHTRRMLALASRVASSM